MEKAIDSSQPKASHGVEDSNLSNEVEELLLTLPREKNFDGTYLYQFDGVWYRHSFLYGMIATQRNPLDQFISQWNLLLKEAHDNKRETLSLEESFEMVCRGIQNSGPLWEHVLGYWKASLDRCPFSNLEENQGVIEEIVKLCSFGNMKDLEVNKIGRNVSGVGPKNYSAFFRKGEVGDWKNYLTPSMSERLECLMEEKFSGSGLSFRLS
ncbi:hypothetical protein Dsin_028082 [Dipteronia sinensis]|uniref:Sulfotransferase n=1 Tax=Dipteronia sinensis TaxID=43782 RepID=A0AAD9ZRD8_9ROSI|nr:hypothetical protein Dsin_028082 [Dipteronia sinensis]